MADVEDSDDPGVDYTIDSGGLVAALIEIAKMCVKNNNNEGAEHFTNIVANLKINKSKVEKRRAEESTEDKGNVAKKRRPAETNAKKNEKQNLKCSECGETFHNEANLLTHVGTAHVENTTPRKGKSRLVVVNHEWKCEICGFFFSRKFNLLRHIREVHEIEPMDKESPKSDVKAVKYKCTLCDQNLAHIYKHYKDKHDIEYPEQILFKNGNVLVISDINTDKGNAPWFINEMKKAEKRYTGTICKLCETVFDNTAILEDHYTLLHMVEPDYLGNIQHLFRAEKNSHLDKTPNQKPRTGNQKRRTSTTGGVSSSRSDKKVDKKFDMVNKKKYVPKSDIGQEQFGDSGLIMYICKCGVSTNSYDVTVEHAQRHLALEYSPITETCSICNCKFEAPCFQEHRARGDCEDNAIKIIEYDYEKLISESWIDMFQNLSNTHVEKIMDLSLYKYSRSVKMNYGTKLGVPMYRCDMCQLFVDPAKVENHCKNSVCVAKKPKGYDCPECDISFYTAKALADHEKIHGTTSQFRIVTFNMKKDSTFNKALEKMRLPSTELNEQEVQEQEIIETPKRPQRNGKPKITEIKRLCKNCNKFVLDSEYEAHEAKHINTAINLNNIINDIDEQVSDSDCNEIDNSLNKTKQNNGEKLKSDITHTIIATMSRSENVHQVVTGVSKSQQNGSDLSKSNNPHRMDIDVEVAVEPWSDESCGDPPYSVLTVQAEINKSVKIDEEKINSNILQPSLSDIIEIEDDTVHSPESLLGELCSINGSQTVLDGNEPTQSTQELLQVLGGDIDIDSNKTENEQEMREKENRVISPDIFNQREGDICNNEKHNPENRQGVINNATQTQQVINDSSSTATYNLSEIKSQDDVVINSKITQKSPISEENENQHQVKDRPKDRISSRAILSRMFPETDNIESDPTTRKQRFESWIQKVSKNLFKKV